MAKPLEVMNEFTFEDKGFSQYAGLLLALSVAALTLYAFALCVRMKMGRKKWVWLLAILVGVCRLTVNWTTGEWFFTPLVFFIPPVSISCTAYGPWMLQIFSPVGAIAFLRLKKGLTSGSDATDCSSPRQGPQTRVQLNALTDPLRQSAAIDYERRTGNPTRHWTREEEHSVGNVVGSADSC